MVATLVAVLTISTFFTASLIVELKGDVLLIKQVKKYILFTLPILLITMPVLGITGNKLAGNTKHPTILKKKRRMTFIFLNGLILIFLAIFLYYRANFGFIDEVFLTAQIAELVFGIINLTLIGMNAKAGLRLSKGARTRKVHIASKY